MADRPPYTPGQKLHLSVSPEQAAECDVPQEQTFEVIDVALTGYPEPEKHWAVSWPGPANQGWAPFHYSLYVGVDGQPEAEGWTLTPESSETKEHDMHPITANCTRPFHEIGPCNGIPREDCPTPKPDNRRGRFDATRLVTGSPWVDADQLTALQESYLEARLLTDAGFRSRWENYRQAAGIEKSGDGPWQVDGLIKIADAEIRQAVSVVSADLEQLLDATGEAQEALQELLGHWETYADGTDASEDIRERLQGALDSINEVL